MKFNLKSSASESPATLPPSVQSPLPEPACTAFEYYLELVCQPLRGVAPEAWVADLRAELSSHLDALAEAYEELGEGREDAVAQACRHLGDPKFLGAQWATHWAEKRTERFGQTVRTAFRHFAVAALLSFLMFSLSMNPGVHGPIADLLRIWGVLIMPLHAGIRFASHSRGRRGPGAAAAILLVAAGIALMGAVIPGSDPTGLRTFLWQSALVYTLPLGSAAAAVAGRLRDRKQRRARRAS